MLFAAYIVASSPPARDAVARTHGPRLLPIGVSNLLAGPRQPRSWQEKRPTVARTPSTVEVQFGGSTYFPVSGITALRQCREGRATLTGVKQALTLMHMEVRFKPETESRLNELASRSGRPANELVEDAMAAYLSEVSELRVRLDGRYEEVKRGSAKLVDGEAFFEELRRRENEPSNRRPPK
jgi:predicted DNA-binding protein